MKSNKPRVLVVGQDLGYAAMLMIILGRTFEVVCALSIEDANQKVLDSLESGRRFSVALVDLWVGEEKGSGADFAKRLIDIVGDINVVLFTYYDKDAILSFKVDKIVIKERLSPGNQSMSEVQCTTLVEAITGMIRPIRRVNVPDDIRRCWWKVTEHLVGSALVYFTKTVIGTGQEQVENITSSTKKDLQWVNTVVYKKLRGDKRGIPVAVKNCNGPCGIGCLFCLAASRKGCGKQGVTARPLRVKELLSQVYLVMLESDRVRATMGKDSYTGICINFTGMGDPFVFNLKNTVRVIEQLAEIEKPQFSFVITTVGREDRISEYLRKYSRLPRTEFYWSVNSAIEKTRSLLMPGTKGQSLLTLRDLFEKIAKKSGKKVTASFALFKGINDDEESAKAVVGLLKDHPWFKIKLMAGCPGTMPCLSDMTDEGVDVFEELLVKHGIERNRIRKRKIFGSGRGQFSGCGTTKPQPEISP